MKRVGFENPTAAKARLNRRLALSSLAPLYRPGFLVSALHRALNPTTLLVEGASRIEEHIERYLEAHRDIPSPRYPRRALQGLLHWLIEAPENAHEATKQGVRRDAASAIVQIVSPVSQTESGQPRQCPVGERPATRGSDYSPRLSLAPEHGLHPSAVPSIQLRLSETNTRNSSATSASPAIESIDDSRFTNCDREAPCRRWPSWLPCIGILPSMTVGLDLNDDEFDGRVLVIQWGRLVFEIFMGKRA